MYIKKKKTTDSFKKWQVYGYSTIEYTVIKIGNNRVTFSCFDKARGRSGGLGQNPWEETITLPLPSGWKLIKDA